MTKQIGPRKEPPDGRSQPDGFEVVDGQRELLQKQTVDDGQQIRSFGLGVYGSGTAQFLGEGRPLGGSPFVEAGR
ncbi:hypothetical protein OOK13_33130 [Streptomyces sp. NBC_00378]|nr:MULTISPECIES: hypothetical protein [unclassified Streptomyces]MCX5113221.1 hypothetical protein [Streptomyces sp. NBC_00378]